MAAARAVVRGSRVKAMCPCKETEVISVNETQYRSLVKTRYNFRDFYCLSSRL